MSEERHLMVCTGGNGTESFFECTVDGCGRRVVIDHVGVRMTVLDRGSGSALHQGSTGVVALSGSIQPGLRPAS